MMNNNQEKQEKNLTVNFQLDLEITKDFTTTSSKLNEELLELAEEGYKSAAFKLIEDTLDSNGFAVSEIKYKPLNPVKINEKHGVFIECEDIQHAIDVEKIIQLLSGSLTTTKITIQ